MRPIALMLILIPASLSAMAQDGQTNRQIRYAERTTIDFDTRDITAETIKPDGKIFMERVPLEFRSLISLRGDFNAEMADSLNAVK